jgi:hypothetical protein
MALGGSDLSAAITAPCSSRSGSFTQANYSPSYSTHVRLSPLPIAPEIPYQEALTQVWQSFTYTDSNGEVFLAVAASTNYACGSAAWTISTVDCTSALNVLAGNSDPSGDNQCANVGGTGVLGCLGYLNEPNPQVRLPLSESEEFGTELTRVCRP